MCDYVNVSVNFRELVLIFFLAALIFLGNTLNTIHLISLSVTDLEAVGGFDPNDNLGMLVFVSRGEDQHVQSFLFLLQMRLVASDDTKFNQSDSRVGRHIGR